MSNLLIGFLYVCCHNYSQSLKLAIYSRWVWHSEIECEIQFYIMKLNPKVLRVVAQFLCCISLAHCWCCFTFCSMQFSIWSAYREDLVLNIPKCPTQIIFQTNKHHQALNGYIYPHNEKTLYTNYMNILQLVRLINPVWLRLLPWQIWDLTFFAAAPQKGLWRKG